MRPDPPFLGQACVVTGASSGIGRAIAIALSEAGGVPVLVGRDKERLVEAVAACPGEAEAAAFDLTDDDAVRRFVDTLPDRVGVVVHSAALAKAGASLDLPVDELDRQFATNVRAPWVLNQAIMPRLEAARGQVVFINSGAGLNARRDFSVYCVTKFGLRAYADALREEVNARGIRVISVYPGRVDTPMQDDLLAFEGRTVPKHTLLTPQDVADTTLAALCQAETAEVVDVRVRPRFTS